MIEGQTAFSQPQKSGELELSSRLMQQVASNINLNTHACIDNDEATALKVTTSKKCNNITTSYTMNIIIQKRMKLSMLFLVISCLFLTSIDAATLTAPRRASKKHKLPPLKVSQNGNSILKLPRGGDSAWMVGLKDSLASALAAACSKTILAPFDTIKTIQQQYQSPNGGSLGFFPACRLIMSRPQGFWSLYVRCIAV